MTITLYTSTAEKIRVDKTSYLTQRSVLSGTLKNETSILRPSILIEAASVNANYMHIAEFSRYYFITNITSISSFLWQIDGVVDPLMSFKGTKNGSASTGIYSLYAFVSRQENSDNDSLTDTAYPAETVGHVTHVEGSVNTGSLWYGSSQFLKDPVVNTNFRYFMQYNGTLQKNTSTMATFFPLTTLIMPYTAAAEIIDKISRETTLSSSGKTILDYIYAFYALPVQANSYTALQKTTTGDTITLNVPGWGNSITKTIGDEIYGYDNRNSFIPVNTYFKVTFSTPDTSYRYRNYRPFTQYFVKFMPFGKLELDPNIIFNPAASLANNTTFYFRVQTDVLSGSASLYYGRTTSTCTNFLASANVKINIPLTASSFNAFKIASGALQFGAGIVGTIAGGNPVGLIPGTMALAEACATPNSTVTGGDMQIIDDVPELTIHNHRQTDVVPSLLGKPYCEEDFLFNLTGYTVCGAVHVENLTGNPTESELTDIENLLTTGIIL